MIRNLEDFPGNREVNADVCIVGAGAAGITLAREFIGASFNVCVLEAGGFDFDLRAQALYEGKNVGFPYYPLDAIRSRYFGGTTNLWAGACRPLDEIDFEIRSGIPDSGWPVSRSNLDPYYARAHDICQLGPYIYDLSYWATPETGPLSFADNDIQTELMQTSSTRFGPTYRGELHQARNVDIYLSSNVVDFGLSPDGQAIRRVHAKSFGGRQLFVSAKFFILATGAIENARLLLASNTVHKSGLGNQNDLVGRYFMEHLSLPSAILSFSNADQLPSALYRGVVMNGVQGQAFLVPSAVLQQREGILNIRAFLVASSAQELAAKSNEAVLSAGFIWNDLRAGRMPRNFERHLRNVISDIDGVAIYSYERSYQPSTTELTLVNHIEQAPNPNSRVSLSDDKDEFGVRRVRLDWQFGDLERKTLDRFNHHVGKAVGRAGLGRIRVLENESGSNWPKGIRGAWHQMGTTRMSDDPKKGVVDSDCRVHELGNMYIAGSSVFPTSGYTNPTLTIVALAIRLADRVKELLL